MTRARIGFVCVGLCMSAVAAIAAGCRSPTEITVVLTTDVPCGETRGATVTVGPPGSIEDKAVAAMSAACTPSDGRIGTIVVVPSGADNDEVGIKVVLGVGRSAADCTPPYGSGCIVARRALHFLPQTPLVVPIHLELACDGIACDPTTTCVHGQCVPAQVSDSSECAVVTGCDEGVLYPDAGRADATLDGPIADGANDALTDGGAPDASNDASIDGTITACGDMGGLAPGAQWPMVGYCPTRLGRSPFVGPQTSHVRWSIPVSEVYATSIAADGTIYFVDNGMLRAVGPDGGAKWSLGSGPTMTSQTPTLGSDGNIYVGAAYEPTIYAFGPDGGVAQTYATGFDAGGAAVDFRATNGTLYVRLWDGPGNTGNVSVGAYDVGTRRLVYATRVDGPSAAELTIANGEVYSGSGAVLRAITPTGATSWAYDGHVTSPALSFALFNGARVTVGTYDGLRSFDSADGGGVWSSPILSTAQAGVTAGPDGTIYVGTSDGFVYAIDPADGGTRWSVPIPTSPNVACTPVVDANGMIYIGTDVSVIALHPDGGTAWSLPASANVRDYITLGDGVLLFHTEFAADGGQTLYAVGQ